MVILYVAETISGNIRHIGSLQSKAVPSEGLPYSSFAEAASIGNFHKGGIGLLDADVAVNHTLQAIKQAMMPAMPIISRR